MQFKISILTAILSFSFFGTAYSQSSSGNAGTADVLEREFLTPPESARPYVWWHWLGSNFSKEGITKDLEAMKASGVGGATIFNISSSVVESHLPTLNNPWPDQTYRSPKYWDAVRHAASEANRLGLEVGLHNTVGYSTTGGPWIDEPRSMQRVVWSETAVNGAQTVKVKLAAPQFVADEGWGKTGRKVSWFRDFAVLAIPANKTEIKLSEILNITSMMDTTGNLNWKAPAGKWLVYRLAHASTGRPPHPVPDDVLMKVLEADKMSLKETKFHWNQVMDPMKKYLGDLVGSMGMKHFLIDSYEAGYQNWTPDFRKEFKKLKGYDPLPWLMTFNTVVQNGKRPATPKDTLFPRQRIVESAEMSARFEADYRDVIRLLFYKNGWEPAAKLIQKAGMTVQHEAYGGPFGTIEGSALADVPMCEFWTGRKVYISPTIIGAARAAGKPVIGAEALTGSPTYSKWTEVPSFLKFSVDAGYAGGVNRMILHHWVHQPFDDKYKPGLGMGWWGTHFNRHQTWFEPGKAFFQYMGRVQSMLQKGETTIYTLSVGGDSYGSDFISGEAFLTDVQVKNGKIVLPSGRTYFVLQVPHQGKLLPETIAKMEKLLRAGATIVSPKPSASPSLKDFPQCDKKVQQLAAQLWGNGNEKIRKIGKGTLYTDGSAQSVQNALAVLGCEQPVKILSSNQDVRVMQRTDGSASWFFAANVGDADEKVSLSFAVANMIPELWDAEKGSISLATVWRKAGNRTEVDIDLGKHKSVFVVFRKSITVNTNQLAGKEKVKPTNLPATDTLNITGEWDVTFQPAIGKPFTTKLAELQSFDQNTNKDIKYFAGTAVYKINVEIPQSAVKNGERFELDLGTVYDMATVTINGSDQGVWWSPPFRGDITKVLKPGSNSIEIAVTNTWHNLLVGDEQYPTDFEWGVDRGANGRMMKGYPEWFLKNEPRPEQNRKGFVVWFYHRKDTPLKPAGLVGPVRIVKEN